MRRQLLIQPAAEADLAEAMDWYERRRRGLGVELMLAVDHTVDLIMTFPAAAAVIHDNVRRVRARGFPYYVYYILDPESVTVIAVRHERRDTRRWIERLGDET